MKQERNVHTETKNEEETRQQTQWYVTSAMYKIWYQNFYYRKYMLKKNRADGPSGIGGMKGGN